MCLLLLMLLLLLGAGALEAPRRCRLGFTPCRDGSDCVSFSHVCDGENDCPDASDEAECPSVCSLGEFQCAHGRKCVVRSQVCDGVAQCQDGSDELECLRPEDDCAHRCLNTRCLPQSFVCDGDADCEDASDEAHCDDDDEADDDDGGSEEGGGVTGAGPTAVASLHCALGSKPCEDGRECVLFSHVCDGEPDCGDASDEEQCALQCQSGEFQCAHGRKCVGRSQVCDGVAQCQDGSDELECLRPEDDCAHRCLNTRCLPQSFVCDGDADCEDASDEAHCDGAEGCGVAQWRCSSGQCVSADMRCDGQLDCRDGSDEVKCVGASACGSAGRCPHSHECLMEQWICDGEKDCKDGSDERDCVERVVQCGGLQWSCSSQTQCVPLAWLCDGAEDCRDASDESRCPNASCLPHEFQCASAGCVDSSRLCDGVSDCPDGSDEGGSCAGPAHNCSAQLACAQECRPTTAGTRCWCMLGYQPVSEGRLCVDVDECVERPGLCSHYCSNSEGSFHCSCAHGYLLEPDGRSCKITGEPYLLASVQSDVFLLGLRSSSLEVLVSAEKRPVLALDYDWQEQRLYWTSLDTDGIKWLTLDQKSRGVAVKGVSGVRVESLAVDWLGRNLYWADGVTQKISAAPLNSSRTVEPVMIVDADLQQIRSLALLPQKGLMFWSETGDEARLERAGMDGSARRVLVSRSLRWPVSLSVDALQDRIYWADEKLKCIGSANLDGGDVKMLQLMETPSPFSISVFNDMIYWSDTKRGTVQRADKSTGKRHGVLLKRPGRPFGLKVVHALLQEAAAHPCSSLRCSHACVLAPGPRGVCKCPARLQLDEGGATCSRATGNWSVLPKSLRPAAGVEVEVESACGAGLCSGKGECVRRGGETACVCRDGYGGQHCQDPLLGGGYRHGPALLAAVGLGVAVVLMGVAIGVARRRRAAGHRPAAQAVLMRESSQKSQPHPEDNLEAAVD